MSLKYVHCKKKAKLTTMKFLKYLFYLISLYCCLISLYAFFYELPAPILDVTEEIIISDDS